MDRVNLLPTTSSFPDPRLAYTNTQPQATMMPFIQEPPAINLQPYNTGQTNQWCLICQTGTTAEEPQFLNIHFTWATKSKSNMASVMTNLVHPSNLKLQVAVF